MTKIYGLAGYRPATESVKSITCPPYDVIKPDTPLEALLISNPDSLYHVTLGETPAAALDRLIQTGALIKDAEPAYYVYEQLYGGIRRTGILCATEVTPYEAREVIRHEKTFDSKVAGRIKLMEDTGYITEPIWLLTKAPVGDVLNEISASFDPVYEFTSDFGGASELCGIHNKIYRVAQESGEGQVISGLIGTGPLYIADGHHRYHSALRMGLDRCIAYICHTDQAKIQAYNRVIRSDSPLDAVWAKLGATASTRFATPARHSFSIYARDGCREYAARSQNEEDVIQRLDCHILEETLYPLLGLGHDMIMDSRYFDYYPEKDIDSMRAVVDSGAYELAVALHPVSPEELMAVAEAGISDPDIVMPEKSTFFSPKILSGLILIPVNR